MNDSVLILTAIGLSIDSFAISIIYGTYSSEKKLRLALKLSIIFGIFHVVMPFIGYQAGTEIRQYFEAFDHWVAFIILLTIGMKMILDGNNEGKSEYKKDYSTGLNVIIYLAFATSIDALAVGISFSLIEIPIYQTICIIGFSTFLFAFIGVWFGQIISSRIKFNFQLFGGVILIFIGFKILIEHLFF